MATLPDLRNGDRLAGRFFRQRLFNLLAGSSICYTVGILRDKTSWNIYAGKRGDSGCVNCNYRNP